MSEEKRNIPKPPPFKKRAPAVIAKDNNQYDEVENINEFISNVNSLIEDASNEDVSVMDETANGQISESEEVSLNLNLDEKEEKNFSEIKTDDDIMIQEEFSADVDNTEDNKSIQNSIENEIAEAKESKDIDGSSEQYKPVFVPATTLDLEGIDGVLVTSEDFDKPVKTTKKEVNIVDLQQEEPRETNIQQSKDGNPVKIKNNKELSITVKAGDGAKTFFGKDGSDIILDIGRGAGEWRLFISHSDMEEVIVDEGEVIRISGDEFTKGVLYNTNNKNIISVNSGDEFAFSSKNQGWNLFLSGLEEVPLRKQEIINLGGKSGILIGPKATSLFFYDVASLKINRKKYGEYSSAEYMEIPENIDEAGRKSFIFSKYHENAFFEGNDEVNTVCLESDENSTYGWNVKFSNGLFMSVDDLIEYQNRNKALPMDSGVLYHGANRLEFSEIKAIKVYKKPFYYGYGVTA